MDKEEIMRKLEAQKEQLNTFSVVKIGLFGSYVKGEQRKESDLDFLVAFSDPTFDNYMDTKFFLEELFGTSVDLVMEGSLKPALQYVKEEALYAQGF
ncbi:MAG: nucleotidyltransferase domain-containing protein [Candidatus Woesearchaeota archaeon]|nr:nucleotidyltransferase domain-containing protein [Candidatus Woesearchaeota archaeon]